MHPIHQSTLWLALVVMLGPSLHAADKYALLIAVSKYDHSGMNKPEPLKYPEADATALGALLKTGGYDVAYLLGKQATRKAVEQQLELLRAKGSSDSVILVGLFGHGIEIETLVDGTTGIRDGCFCPFDTDLRTVKDANGREIFGNDRLPLTEPDPATLIKLSGLLGTLGRAKAGHRVLLADCCRTIPNQARGRNFGTDFQRQPLPDNTSVLFGCSPNEQAFEHPNWEHGAFTKCLLEELQSLALMGEVDTGLLASRLRKKVPALVATVNPRNTQTPKLFGTDLVDLQLKPSQLGPPAPLSAPFNAATAQAGQAAWAKFLGKPIIEKTGIGLELTLIPPGEFLMGSSAADVQAALAADSNLKAENFDDEQPQHRVRITKPFRLGTYEVTQAEYEQVMGSNPSYFSAAGDGKSSVSGITTSRFPVEQVSWYDAVEFCNKLSSLEGLPAYYELTDIERKEGSISSATVREKNNGGYRLPTEAEWEYACRAGTTTAFHFGDVNNGQESNIDGNTPYGTATKGPFKARTTAVGSFGANGFGLRDMHGNVWELCGDWYDAEFYGKSNGTTVDPFSASSGDNRVLRGGSWFILGARYTRVAYRNRYTPDYRNSSTGFRVSRTP